MGLAEACECKENTYFSCFITIWILNDFKCVKKADEKDMKHGVKTRISPWLHSQEETK